MRIAINFNLIRIQKYTIVEKRHLGHLGKEGFFIKGKNNIWKRHWLESAYFNPKLPLYRNNHIDLLHKSVDWIV